MDNIIVWDESSQRLRALKNFTLNSYPILKNHIYYLRPQEYTGPSTSGYGGEKVWELFLETGVFTTLVGQSTLKRNDLFQIL